MLSAQYAGWGTKIGLFFAGTSVLCWIPCYFLFPEVSDDRGGIVSDPFSLSFPGNPSGEF